MRFRLVSSSSSDAIQEAPHSVTTSRQTSDKRSDRDDAARRLALTAARVADETRASDVRVLDLRGLTEVFDRADNEMGLEGVKQVLAAGAGAPLPALAGHILEAARRHGPQLDDQTILLVRHLL